MNWRNRLLLGSAASLMAVAGAQAADLPVKAKPVEYVRICTAYGAGFYFIPGTDICLRVGGYVYAETGWNGRSAVPLLYSGNIGQNLIYNADDNWINFRVRGTLILDARAQTAIGTVRTYIAFGADYNNNQNGAGPGGNVTPYLERAFTQFAGFTAGYTASFFDFGGWYSPYTLSSIAYHWTPLFAYTARLGDGFSATISIEDGQGIRTKVISNAQAFTGFQTAAFNGYGGQEVPDIVANLRADGVWGSAQISGALHQIRLNQALNTGTAPLTPGPQSDLWGWAILGGIEIKTPMIAPGDSVILQAAYARGAVEYTGLSASASGFATTIGRKNVAGVGPGADMYDAACIGAPFGCELSSAWSANLFFRHFWQPNLRSAFWVGYNHYRPGWSGTANPAFNASPNLTIWQAGGNVIWSPARTLDLSLDVLWSRVETASCAGSALAASTCNLTADIFTVWTRWRRNF